MKRNRRRSIYRFVRGLGIVLLTTGVTAGLVFGGLALSKWARTSSSFNLNTIVVTGNRTIDKADVITVSGLERGRNIWSANLMETGRRLMRDSRFERVELTRRLPDKVVVRVKELRLVAFVQLDRLYGVSEHAELVVPSLGNGLPDLPVITLAEPSNPTGSTETIRQPSPSAIPRDAIRANPEVDRALYLIRMLKTMSPALYDELSEVHVSGPNDLIVYMVEGGLTIRFGAGHYARKVAMLKQTVSKLEADAIRTRLIDLRFKDQVIVRPIVSARSRERHL